MWVLSSLGFYDLNQSLTQALAFRWFISSPSSASLLPRAESFLLGSDPRASASSRVVVRGLPRVSGNNNVYPDISQVHAEGCNHAANTAHHTATTHGQSPGGRAHSQQGMSVHSHVPTTTTTITTSNYREETLLIQHGQLLLGLCRLPRLVQQSSSALSLLRLQELLHLQFAFDAVEAGDGVQQGLSVLVAALGHQIKGRLWELPAEEQEGRRACGEDDLVDPPDPHQVAGQRHHHDADSKGRVHVHGGPRAYFDASELRDVDKHHHQVAAGHLPKAEMGRRRKMRSYVKYLGLMRRALRHWLSSHCAPSVVFTTKGPVPDLKTGKMSSRLDAVRLPYRTAVMLPGTLHTKFGVCTRKTEAR
ncbi:hypothetical protein EYF80_021115 [Liparis tanakae]|uniref:Uncharacterized protein n=1 Tax=Liparis tanakae TaxID=230148 RepID=A0A4Z2HSS3_9TELE|nr:hypothetical protein EYF80_021115 [Liparis tanakae]